MLKISVALLLIALAMNASAKPWHHQARSFGNIQSGDVETNEVGDSSSTDPKSEENEVNVDDDYYEDDDEPEESNNADKEKLLNKRLFEGLKQELMDRSDHVFRKKIEEIFSKHPEPDFSDWDNVNEVYNKILKDVQEYMKSIGLTISKGEEDSSSEGSASDVSSTPKPGNDSDEGDVPPEPENNGEGSIEDGSEESDDSKKDLFKYVFQSLTQDLVNSADPELRDDVQEIVNKYGEPDFSDEEEVEELYQKILKEVKAFLKSKGIATSSEEQGTSSEEGSGSTHSTTAASVEEPESSEESESDESGVETDDVTTEEPEEKPESGSNEGSDEGSDPSDRKNLLKYVFKSLTQDLVNSADPEIRDDVQEIVNKYGEPDFSDGEEVEELYQKILKEVKAFLKSKGISTSSEEQGTSSEEGSGSTHSTTATSVEVPESSEESESNESGVETDDVTTKEPEEKPESGSNEGSDEGSDPSDRKNLLKYVFKSLTQDLVNSADPEIRDDVQEIVNKYGEPDFSDGEEVEELYQKILKEVKAFLKSKGIATSSEEQGTSSEEGSGSTHSTTSASVEEPESSEESESDESGVETDDVTTEEPEEKPESGSNEGSDEGSDPSDRKNLLKYVFKSLTQDLVNSADPEIRDDVQEIVNKYGEPDFSDGEEVEELYQKILKEVKAFLKSKGIATSSEEQGTSSEEGSGSTHSTTSASVEEPESSEESESDESGVESDDVTTEEPEEKPESGSHEGSDEESDPSDRKNLLKYVFKSLTQDLVNSADPEIRDDVQEIVNKYGEPDFSDGEEVEELYQKILKEVKAFLKSKGIKIATSSEEQGTSSEEGSGSTHSTTAASVDEPESSEESGSDESGVETDDVTTEEPEGSDEGTDSSDRKKELLKYVFQSLTHDLVDSADPEIRDEVQNIVNRHGEPDYADGDKVEEHYQKILKDVKDYKKSKGIETSSEEENSSSEEDSSSNLGTTAAPVQQDSDEGHGSDEGNEDDDVNTEKPVEEPENGSDEGNEGSDDDTDEDGSNNTTQELLKYVFQSLKKDILEKADPEIRDKIQEIFDKYGEPDYSDPEKVEEVYQKILKDIQDYKKSKGLPTSSEEQGSSEGVVTVTTAAPVQTSESDEDESAEVGAEEVTTAKPNREQGHDSDEEDDSDEEEDSNDRKTQLYKYVFKTLKKDLLHNADPETRAKIQEIFDNNPVHDFSDGEGVEEVYKKILEDVKEYKKSKGLTTSSEEDDV